MHRLAVIAAVAALAPSARADSFGPVWRVNAALGQLVVAGDRLVEVTGAGLRVIDPYDGHRGPMLVPFAWGEPRAIDVAGGRIVVATEKPGWVYGFATPSRSDIAIEPRWKLGLGIGEHVPRIAAEPELTVLEVTTEVRVGPNKTELVAIVGGAVAWRHELGATVAVSALSVHAGRVAVAAVSGNPGDLKTFAFELDGDGRQRWSYETELGTGVAVGERFVAIAHEPYLTIIDRAGGVPFDALIGPIASPVVTIVDDIAYVTGARELDERGAVVAVGLADRRLRWRHAIDSERMSSIAIGPTMVFVHASTDELVALDRNTGGEIWRYGLGQAAEMVTIGNRVVVYDNDRAIAFGPVATEPPFENAVITGKITINCDTTDVVTVAGVTTPRRSDGTFTAHIRGRGAVSVVALESWQARVDLVGRRRYDVGALTMDRCGD